MPIIVGCPNCAGQLRVADDLIGRKVRCPACNATFDAVAPQSEPSPGEETISRRQVPDMELEAPPERTERIDPWKALNLELPEDKNRRSPDKPFGFREEDDPAEEAAKPERRNRPRLSNDNEDTRPCPNCGRMVHRDVRRCVSCGERFGSRSKEEEYDEDYDEQRRNRRRRKFDCEPHRGGFVLTLGIISLATPFTCWPLSILAVIPGIMAWAMGSSDLKKMRGGDMDPDGESNTKAGWICGIIGTLINLVIVLGCAGFISFVMIMEQQRPNPQRNAPFGPPPPVRMPR